MINKFKNSADYFSKSKKIIPGGVNSPVRSFQGVNSMPFFTNRANGSRIYDEDENEYIDCVCSWGPLILGHSNQDVVNAVSNAVKNGLTYGTPTALEYEFANLICDAVKSVEMLRLTSSGTEAVMSAIRLARAYTKRKYILKFEGCYHGHSDSMLVKAGSGLASAGIPDSLGVPNETAQLTITVPFNNMEAVDIAFSKYGDEIAAVIIEPIAANMGVILPVKDYLKYLRDITQQYGSLLIFDEVITGFRIGYGSVSKIYDVDADLTVMGKIIGGGMPLAAYGGKKEIMQLIAPLGHVYQAGTLSGNPVAVTAGLTTLKILRDNPLIYDELDMKSSILKIELLNSAKRKGIDLQINRCGSILTVFFNSNKVENFSLAKNSDIKRYTNYFKTMINNGVYVPPSMFEAMFISAAHSFADIEKIIDIFDKNII